jgi:O-antigen ligase
VTLRIPTRLYKIAPLLIGGLFLGGVAVALPHTYLLVIVAVALAGVVLFWRPNWAVVGLMLLKASMDNLSQTITLFQGAPYQVNINGLLNVLVVLLATFFILTGRVRPTRFALLRPMTLLLVIGAIGLLISSEPMSVLREWVRLASLPAVFLLVVAGGRSRASKRRLISVILLSAIVPCLVGFYQVLTGRGYTISVGFNRAYGTFWFPNGLAFYLLVVVALLFPTYQKTRSMLLRVLMLGLGAMCGLTLLLTYTRAAWGSLILMAGVVAILRYRKWLIIGPIVLLLIVVAVPSVRQRVADLITPQTLSLQRVYRVDQTTLGSSNSFQWRLLLWSDTIHYVGKNPLLGQGLASYPRLAAASEIGIEIAAHNDYLRMLIEVGVLGLVAYLGVQWQVVRMAWQAFKTTGEQHLMGLWLLALYLAILAVSLTDNILSYHTVGWYLWTFIALVHLPDADKNYVH